MAEHFILQHEATLRLTAFAIILLGMAGWELLSPRRPLSQSRRRRWFANLAMVAIDAGVLRILFPVLAVGMAVLADARGIGLLNAITLPRWLEVAAAVLALDLTIYWQHRLFHAIPALWRLHRVHHADLDFDVTTGLRFHPVEIALSMLIKLAAVVALGAPALGVLLFEVMLNGTAMFNHGNVRLPPALDRWLRRVVVTPEMHRVHHSVIRSETDSNFGFNLPWWDRLFGSYRAQPAAGHEGMTIGLPEYRTPDCASLGWMLLLPFRSNAPVAGRVGRSHL